MLGGDAFFDKLFPILEEESALREVPAANPVAPHCVNGGASRNLASEIEENVICVIYNILKILI